MPSGCKVVRELSEKCDAAVLSYLKRNDFNDQKTMQSENDKRENRMIIEKNVIYFHCSVHNKFVKYF